MTTSANVYNVLITDVQISQVEPVNLGNLVRFLQFFPITRSHVRSTPDLSVIAKILYRCHTQGRHATPINVPKKSA